MIKKRKGQQLIKSMKEKYAELHVIIKDEKFKTFGFAVSGPHHKFIKELEALSYHKDNTAVHKLLKVTGGMLLHLAYSYSVSKGAGNEATANLERQFKKAFK